MKRLTWHKHHKWFGLAVCFFMLMFSLSGIVLNHRTMVSGVNVSRRWLPSRYRFHDWNGGLMRGTVRFDSTRTLIYGAGGMWLANADGSVIEDFNGGLPAGADCRNIRRVLKSERGQWAAVSPFGLYLLRNGRWTHTAFGERLTDIAQRGDTLVVLGRSFAYSSIYPYREFRRHQLAAPDGYESRVTLFRQMWLLHSGELFGTSGKLVVDGIALVIIALSVTGFICWLPERRGKSRRKGGGVEPANAPNDKAADGTGLMHAPCATARRTPLGAMKRWSARWHDRLGRWTIALTLLLCLTGWCLRPPLMIPLVMNSTEPPPGIALSGPNKWHDKLRMIAFDEEFGDWLVSTSDGFFAFSGPEAAPVPVRGAPPVSVMGLNVLHKDGDGNWLCGSFSGMYRFDRSRGVATDFFTGEPVAGGGSSPFGLTAVSGYSGELGAVVEYGGGTGCIPQPERLATLPMSLWNVALEVHSGRIYIGDLATMLFVFVAGGCAMWCLWSGWRIRKRR